MKKHFVLKLMSVVTLSLLVGCGDSGNTTGGSEIPATIKNPPKPVVLNPIETPSPAPFTKQNFWELSKEGAPTYQLATSGAVIDFDPIIKDAHPRLYFNPSDYNYLQSKLTTSAWGTLKASVTSRLGGKTTQEALVLLDSYEEGDAEYAKLMAFLAYMERDPYYINLTIEWAKHLSTKTPENSEGDILLRRRIERLSEIYDWLYDDLSATDKATIRSALKNHVDQLMSFDYMQTTRNYIQKHSRWGDGVVAQALLAMYDDFDATFTKVYADNLLSSTREHLRKYSDAESYIASDGGWHLGWGYAYFNANYMFNYFIWSTATDETMLDDWMGDLNYWYLYALRADKTLPQMGDATISSMGYGILAALYQSTLKRDGFAKWYVDESQNTYNDLFARFLLQDDSVVAKSPATLPTSRYFKQVGTVVVRDSWNFDEATMLIFKSSPFYNAGHHHRDENSFTIDYKTSLALDAGFYDLTDSPQYKNYYIRTIAHNAITVYNPNQKMYYITDYNHDWTQAEKLLVNDGGQIFRDPDSIEKADIVEGGINRLDGIVKYQYSGSYTYMVADATKAYDNATVSLAKRAIMYVEDAGYNHPVILVLDKIEATDGAYQKRYLLHMQPDDLPSVSGNKMSMTASSSRASAQMVNLTLYPSNATVRAIGGAGHEYALMDGSNPEPFDAAIVREIKADQDTKYGTWRLEVSPPVGKKYDVMLNAIFVDDAGVVINTDATTRIESDSAVGVQLPNRIVVFSKDKADAAIPVEYHVASDSNLHHTVATGYAAGSSVKVYKNGVATSGFIVGEGGCVDFTIDAKTADIIKVAQ